MGKIVIIVLLLAGLAFAQSTTAPAPPDPPAQAKSEIPEVTADLGDCTAEFTVTDTANKPVFNAKVHTEIRHGLFSMRRVELEIGTNADGKARFVGLPNTVRKPFAFEISYQNRRNYIRHNPEEKCTAAYNVILPDRPSKPLEE